MIDREIVSADGELRLLVQPAGDDLILGFDGYPWHTHGDLLARHYGGSPESAAKKFVDALVGGNLIIAIERVSGTIRDIRITFDPEEDIRYCPPDESVEFRLWDRTVVKAIGSTPGGVARMSD